MASVYFLSPARHVEVNDPVGLSMPDVEVFKIVGTAEDSGWYFHARFPDESDYHAEPKGPYADADAALGAAIAEYVTEEQVKTAMRVLA